MQLTQTNSRWWISWRLARWDGVGIDSGASPQALGTRSRARTASETRSFPPMLKGRALAYKSVRSDHVDKIDK